MTQFLMIPTNENGVLLDPYLLGDLGTTVEQHHLAFSHLFLYSHGWWTSGGRAMNEYNRFSLEFAASLVASGRQHLPQSFLAVGVRWPSMLSEDDRSPTNYLEATSFYIMEKRADTIGDNAGFALLMDIPKSASPLGLTEIVLIGHSFGCRVAGATLAKIAELKRRTAGVVPNSVRFHVILLQAAFAADALTPSDGSYCGRLKLPARLLVTRSDKDVALKRWYPDVHALIDIVKRGHKEPALGGDEPAAADLQQIAAATGTPSWKMVEVAPGATAVDLLSERLVLADLTPLHDTPALRPDDESAFSGRHSDIFRPEIYALIASFLFPVGGGISSPERQE